MISAKILKYLVGECLLKFCAYFQCWCECICPKDDKKSPAWRWGRADSSMTSSLPPRFRGEESASWQAFAFYPNSHFCCCLRQNRADREGCLNLWSSSRFLRSQLSNSLKISLESCLNTVLYAKNKVPKELSGKLNKNHLVYPTRRLSEDTAVD